MRNIYAIILLLGCFVLQYFLSKKGKRLGLILPALTFIYSLVVVLNLGMVSNVSLIIFVTLSFLLANVPTLILLAIYFGVRKDSGDYFDDLMNKK